MKEEIIIITIYQDTFRVYSQEFKPYPGLSITYLDIPPGILRSDYSLCQIRIERKEVIKP